MKVVIFIICHSSKVQGYWHQCTIPANGMNLVIFDLVNIVMALIIISALITLAWYLRILLPWKDRLCMGWCANTKWVLRMKLENRKPNNSSTILGLVVF